MSQASAALPLHRLPDINHVECRCRNDWANHLVCMSSRTTRVRLKRGNNGRCTNIEMY